MKKNIPMVRFTGFSEAWEQRKVSDLFKVTRGNVLAATKTSKTKTVTMKYPVYSSQTLNEGLMGYYNEYLFENAITWTTDGANAGTVMYRPNKFYSTNVNGVLLSDEGYASKAISEALNLVAWKHVSRVGNPKLMNNVMGEIVISIPPNNDEIIKISSLLNRIDETITLLQRKLILLEELKKSMLNHLFPTSGSLVPAIRFDGFTDDWVHRKLEDVSKITMGQSPSSKYYTDNPKDHILVQGNADMVKGKVVPRVWTTNVTKTADVNDIIFSVRAPVGDIGKTDYPLVIGRGVASIKGNNFVFFDLFKKNSINYWDRVSTGSTFESINSYELKNASIHVPKDQEQVFIGNLMNYLDKTITLHQRKLELLKLKKQYFLKVLFV